MKLLDIIAESGLQDEMILLELFSHNEHMKRAQRVRMLGSGRLCMYIMCRSIYTTGTANVGYVFFWCDSKLIAATPPPCPYRFMSECHEWSG